MIPVFWFGISSGLGTALCFMASSGSGVPIGVVVVFGVLVAMGFLTGVAIVFAYVRLSEDAVESWFVFKRRILWSDVTAWTQWGEDGSVFVRTRCGRTKGLDNKCVYGKRRRLLRAILEDRIGPETRGAGAVMPPFLKAVVGVVPGAAASEPTRKKSNDEA
jgi:hypothetical protein